MITSAPFLWGVVLGGLLARYFTRRCPNCGTRAIDPGAILAHGAQRS